MSVDIRQERAAAIERRQARRWEPVDARKAVAVALLEGRDVPQIHNQWSGPEFTAPSSLGEWVDDRLCERATWVEDDPVDQLLVTVVAAAREGRDAAVKAVRGARRLTPVQQYCAFSNLMAWRSAGFTPADPVLSAVAAEWRGLKLAEARPEDGR